MLRVYKIDRARKAMLQRERLRQAGLFIGLACWLVCALSGIALLLWGC